jgi:hypothetical protein
MAIFLCSFVTQRRCMSPFLYQLPPAVIAFFAHKAIAAPDQFMKKWCPIRFPWGPFLLTIPLQHLQRYQFHVTPAPAHDPGWADRADWARFLVSLFCGFIPQAYQRYGSSIIGNTTRQCRHAITHFLLYGTCRPLHGRSSLLHIILKRVAGRAPPADRHHVYLAPFVIHADVRPHHVPASHYTATGDGAAGVVAVRTTAHTIHRWVALMIKVCDKNKNHPAPAQAGMS